MTELRAFLVTTARNDAPYFLEWVAHHQALGFTDIVIFQNDSDDLTHETLSMLRKIGAVQYFYNRGAKGQRRAHAYARAAALEAFNQCTWGMALDMDEFLVIKTGDGTLTDLMRVLPESDCIHLNRRSFGNSGYEVLTDQLVTERFAMADHPLAGPDHFSDFKCLFRTSVFQEPGVPHPHSLAPPETLRYTNGSGLPAGDYVLKDSASTDPKGCVHAQINHYATRDLASFMLKAANPEIGQKEWVACNTNFEIDDSMQPLLARVKAGMAALNTASEGRLLELREVAIFTHLARYYTQLQDPQMRAFRRFCKAHPNAVDARKAKKTKPAVAAKTAKPKTRTARTTKTAKKPTATAVT